MSDVPPWFSEGLDALEIGESVLPVGKHTCPFCDSGGDPEGWSISATHAQLVTFNAPQVINITVSGTFAVDWERIRITESGSAASCAKRLTKTDGRSGTIEFEFLNAVDVPPQSCLPIANSVGYLATLGGDADPSPQTAELEITDNLVGEAICGSTGCTSGDFGEYNDDDTGDLIASNVDAATFAEKVCRSGADTYRYTFTGEARVELSEGGYVKAFLYTGDFDWSRWGGEPAELSNPEYTLSGEVGVGTVRGGLAVKAKYLTFEFDHANSIVSGTPNNCPNPAYSSDVTIGTTTGDIGVAISG